MKKDYYLNLLNERFQKHFQINNNKLILGETFDIYAKYSEVTGRTFVTQKDIIDKFEVNEHCFIKVLDSVNLETIYGFTEFLKQLTVSFVKPHREHRSTNLTGVIVSEKPINKEIEKFVTKFKYCRYYKLYLQGYSDVRLVVVDLHNKTTITNRKGEHVKKVYLPTP